MDPTKVLPELLSALPLTLMIIGVSMLIGLCLAVTAASLRVNRVRGLSRAIDLYVSYSRSVPVVLQLFVAFYGLPLVIGMAGDNFIDPHSVGPTAASIIGLSFYHGGYLSEVLRPAYLAVDRGQHEAADSLGYSKLQKFRRILVPQAVHVALPGYGNAVIYLIHNAALVMYIGAADVMATAHVIMERSYNQYQFSTYLLLAVLYSLLCLVVWVVVKIFENRFGKYTIATAPVKNSLLGAV